MYWTWHLVFCLCTIVNPPPKPLPSYIYLYSVQSVHAIPKGQCTWTLNLDQNGVTNEATVIEWAAAAAWWRLGGSEKAMGRCTARLKMLLFRAKTIVTDWGNVELSCLKKEERTICPFCECLVWYFRDGFSRCEESCWSWKHSKMNGMWW